MLSFRILLASALLLAAPAPAVFQENAIDFDGATEYLENSTSQNIGIANDFTISTWIDADVSENAGIIDFNGSANRVIFNLFTSTDFRAQLFNSSGTAFKRYEFGTVATGERTMVSLTWDGSSLKVYQDGTEDASPTKTTDNAGTMTSTNRTITVGGTSGTAGINGKVSTASIWDTALSSAAIAAIYDSGNGFKLDLRDSTGSYTETANLKHQWALGKNTSPNIGEDFVSSGGINIETNAANISDADIVTF